MTMLKPRYRLTKEPAQPLPGSAEAQQAGCTCPRSPNDGGWGVATVDGMTWWADAQCPIHGRLGIRP